MIINPEKNEGSIVWDTLFEDSPSKVTFKDGDGNVTSSVSIPANKHINIYNYYKNNKEVEPHQIVITGSAYIGSTLTSTKSAQWFLNGEPIVGETGNTLTVPETVILGDEISQQGSNTLTVIRIPLALGININTELAGDTGSDGFRLPARNDTGYDCRVYWGDGTYSDIDAYNHPDLEHTYDDGGVYDIQISGTFRGFYFNNGGDRQKLLRIDQWGDTGQESNQNAAFLGCINLTTLSPDMTLPSLTNGTNTFRDTPITTLPDGMTLPNLTNGNAMFYNTNLTTLPDDMTLPNLTNGQDTFRDTPITTLPDGMTLPNLTTGVRMFDGTNLTTLPDGMTLPNLTIGRYMFSGTSLTALPDDMTLPNLINGSVMFQNTSLTTLPDDMTLPNLTNGSNMFYGTNLTTLPDDMTLPNLTNGQGMFNLTNLTTTRYSQLLIDLSDHNPNNNVVFHGGNAKYNESAAPARYALYMRQWNVTDGGADFETPILFGLPHAESLLWSTHTGQWAIDGTPVVGETGQTFTIPDDVTDGQEITQLDSDPLIVSNLDPDALNYILRVEDADQYPLEPAVKTAINDLFLEWKNAPAPIAANNWTAIAAGTGLLMAGPRTLAGALVPLDPNMPNPTNTNFVQGDYNRKAGLKGSDGTKRILLGRNNDDSPMDDSHLSVFITELNPTANLGILGSDPSVNTHQKRIWSTSTAHNNAEFTPITHSLGFTGISRSNSSDYELQSVGITTLIEEASLGVDPNELTLFARSSDGFNGVDCRIPFVSEGQAIDLEAMDTALTAYMAAIGSAI